MAGREAVEEGEVVELSVAPAFLNEVVVEVVHATGVGTQENAISDEMFSHIRRVDAIEEVLEFGEFLRRPSRIA